MGLCRTGPRRARQVAVLAGLVWPDQEEPDAPPGSMASASQRRCFKRLVTELCHTEMALGSIFLRECWAGFNEGWDSRSRDPNGSPL